MLRLVIGKGEAEVKVFKFPAGESGVSFGEAFPQNYQEPQAACITLSWEGNDDLINLALLGDAIRRQHPKIELSLNIPYFPYARQDRVCNKGESLSVKVIAGIINAMGFSRVYVIDPHSEVLGAVLNNMIVVSTNDKIHLAMVDIKGSVAFVSPDAGANKKVLGYAKAMGGTPVIRADKVRDTATGAITNTVVYSEHLGKTNLLVIDDIGDGLGTFIPLAHELRKITTGTVNLLLSHGIFTKGVDILQGVYDNTYVINNMYGAHPLIKEI